MHVGIPGQDPLRPEPAPRTGVGHVAKWLLAAVGAACAYLAVQVVGVVAASVAQTASALSRGAAPMSGNALEQVSFGATALALAFAALWWRRLRPDALVRRGADGSSRPLRRVPVGCALLALGAVLQVAISAALTLVLPLFPQVMSDYLELMELAGMTGEVGLLTLVELAVCAPIAEEALCRGVVLEFALRAFCPQRGPACEGVPTARFWAANVIQALIFGVMHLNLVQGCYAFALGLLLGWLVRRTGDLSAAALLHMAVNGSSALVDLAAPLLDGALVPVLVVGGLVAAALVGLVARLTAEPRGDADTL